MLTAGSPQVKELQRALALGKMHFSLAVCRQIIRYAALQQGMRMSQGLAKRASCRLYDKTNTGSITLRDFGELNNFLEKVQGQYRQHNRSGQGLGPQEVWCTLPACTSSS